MPDLGRPFRVLVLDDVTFNQWEARRRRQITESGGDISPFAKLVFEQLTRISDQPNLEIYLAGDVQLTPDTFAQISGPGNEQMIRERLQNKDGAEDFLRSLDVLILDLRGVKSPRKPWKVTKSECPQASDSELEELNSTYGGAGFYLRLRETALRDCQAIIIVTQYDRQGVSVLEKYIDPLCNEDSIPWTTKRGLIHQDLVAVHDLITSLYLDFSQGYVKFQNRGAIEFAASHDLPVLIVGESGTGKEGIAQAVHRRWVQEKARKGITVLERPAVINCGGLLPELARSELFGHVRGAFTGADGHRLGRILEACGLRLASSAGRLPRGADRGEEFRRLLMSENRNSLIENAPDILLTKTGPFGTLFLDEFGDLPFDVQILLLRYLETSDVEPVGLGGRVVGAQVRIIAATSDPRVARFVGERILSSRSHNEPPKPLREDLMFRLCGQVIKAQGISSQNAVQEVRILIANQAHNIAVTWQEEAILELGKLVSEKLESVVTAHQAVHNEATLSESMPAFGHWRELNRFIRLVNVYVASAQERGIRAIPPSVSQEIVKRLWRPAPIIRTQIRNSSDYSSFRVGDVEHTGDHKQTLSKIWSASDFIAAGVVEHGSKECALLERLLTKTNNIVSFTELRYVFKSQGSFEAAVSRLRSKWPVSCGFIFAKRGAKIIKRVN